MDELESDIEVGEEAKIKQDHQRDGHLNAE
jgi:hypothetical protein